MFSTLMIIGLNVLVTLCIDTFYWFYIYINFLPTNRNDWLFYWGNTLDKVFQLNYSSINQLLFAQSQEVLCQEHYSVVEYIQSMTILNIWMLLLIKTYGIYKT